QNLGNVDKVEYIGFEAEVSAFLTDAFSVYAGLGYTDSEIKKAAEPADEGNHAPLVSKYTLNLGGEYRQPLGGQMQLVGRIDYQRIGDTWWEPQNLSKRSPVDLVDARLGLEVPGNWSLVLWGKNVFDEEYNAEFSPGPATGANFLFKAPPRRWGLDFTKRF
ncbi:MAG: TonB-dependent receptor, partial [Gammaproteobacteria bacterium]